MQGVLNFIGRIFWLSVLTFVLGLLCVSLTRLERNNTKVEGRQINSIAKLQKKVKLKEVANITPKAQQLANVPEALPTPTGPSLITTVLGTMDYIAKLQKPYWPYREGIDCTVQKCVALTFDDGPSPNTSALLDLLKAKDAKATFFVLGLQIEQYPKILSRMISEQHEIGNHTYHHKNLKKSTPEEVANEINTTQNLISSLTNYKPHIVRPPMGEFTKDDSTLANYPIILWSADPWDWKSRNSVLIDQESIKQIKPGSILLLHDIYPTSISAVPPIIDNLKQQGYTLVTITELFGWKDPAAPLPNGQLLRSR